MQDFGSTATQTIKLPWGEFAWHIKDNACAIKMVKDMNGIILGGDILTDQIKYTYDNWYYNPVWNIKLDYNSAVLLNSAASIQYAVEYINQYVQLHGENFLVVFTVCSQSEAINHMHLE